MSFKLLMSWDIKPGRETEYFHFVMHEFAPEMMKLGFKPTEAWYTVYGNGPQILTSGETSSRHAMEAIMQGEDWQTLKGKLDAYIYNFRQKVVPSTGKFQML